MKYFSTLFLIFVEVITFSLAEPLLSTVCPKVPTKNNFQPKRYFMGKWYYTHIYTPSSTPDYPSDRLCLKVASTVFGNNIARMIYDSQKPNVSEQHTYTETYINLNEFQTCLGDYIGVSRLIDKDENPLINEFTEVQITVIETDYDHYSFVRMCIPVKDDNKYIVSYGILNRNLDIFPPSEVLSIFPKIPLMTIHNFYSIKDLKCEE